VYKNLKNKLLAMLVLSITLISPFVSVQASNAAWVSDGSNWRYEQNGTYAVSWLSWNGKWYYFNSNGTMATGWVLDGTKWYYLGADGAMLANTTTPDGYYVNSSGVYIPNIHISDSNNSYQITTNTYKNANITVSYPQISNLADNDKQTRINNLIKAAVFDDYGITEMIKTGFIPIYDEPVENLTMDVTYTIELQNTNILSIKYLGEAYVKNAAHPYNELYTTNIDISNENILKLPDIVRIDQAFVNAFRKGTYIPWFEISGDDIKQLNAAISTAMSDYNDSGLKTAFEQSDKTEVSGNPYSVYCYLTKEGIVVSISVAHVTGDHAEFEIPYNSIKDNIKIINFLQ